MSIEQLKIELETGRKEIKTDNYTMSIGEIINLYKDNELKLDPAFQRLFRWKDYQKTRFIESILLGIPIPSIFVAQKPDGKWVIIDGVQRLSTILQFTGELKSYDELILTEAKKLPSLEGFKWSTISIDIQRHIKRAKLGVNIILTENSVDAQYELFQRLNTGGSHLEPQEIRNCLIIMLKPEFYNIINELKEYESYKNCLQLSEEKFKIEHHMELLIRYFIAKRNKVVYSKYVVSRTLLSDFIDEETKNLIDDQEFDLEKEVEIFKETFDFLNKKLDKDSFKKYNSDKRNFEGPLLESSFEAILPGLACNIDKFKGYDYSQIKSIIIKLYEEADYLEAISRGKKAISRIQELTRFSIKYFSEI